MHIHRATQQKTELYNEPTLKGAKKQLRKETSGATRFFPNETGLAFILRRDLAKSKLWGQRKNYSLSPKVPRSRHLLGGGRGRKFPSSQNAPSRNVLLFLRAGVEFLREELEEAKC